MDKITIELQEKCDTVIARKVLSSGSITKDNYRSLSAYINRGVKHQPPHIPIVYTCENGIGRFKSKAKSKGGSYIIHYAQGMLREIRSSIASSIYHDIDMANAQPTIMEYLFNKFDILCPQLSNYNKNRDSIIETLSDTTQLPPSKIKELYLRICCSGSVYTWCSEHERDASEIPKSVFDLQEEVRNNIPHLLVHYPDIIKHQQQHNNGSKNPIGTQFSLLCQTKERECLMALYQYIKDDGFCIGALIHDGLFVERKTKFPEGISIDYLEKWETQIQASLGIPIKLKEKQMEISDTLISTAKSDTGEEFIAENDDIASDIFLKVYSKHLKKTRNGRVLVRLQNNIWSENKDVIANELLAKSLRLNIVRPNFNDYSKDVGCAQRIIKASIAKLDEDYDFIDNLWFSNLQKLVFKNGVFDFKTFKFYDWTHQSSQDTQSLIRINRDYPVEPPSQDILDQVQHRIWDAIFPEKELQNYFKYYLARALAGHVEEKQWAICLGQRNAGKGIIIGCMQNAFQGYIGTTNSENFMYQKESSSDQAKKQSWMLDHEYTRICFSNEINTNENNTLKINGNMIKRFASGFDELCCRKNYEDEKYFKVQARFIAMCNDVPPVQPEDAMEFCTTVKFPVKFVSQDEYNALKEKHNYKIKNDNLKEWCRQPEVIDAFTLGIINAYTETVEQPQDIKDFKKDFSVDSTSDDQLDKVFQFTNRHADYLSAQDVRSILKQNGITMSFPKIKHFHFPQRGVVEDTIKVNGKQTKIYRNMCVASEKENVDEIN